MYDMTGENAENGFRQSGSTRSNAPYFKDTNVAMSYTFVPSAGAANVCNVLISQLDGQGNLITSGTPFRLWLSDSASGLGLTGTTASGTVQVKSGAGFDLGILSAKKSLSVQTLATGLYTLEITDTAKTGFYIAAQNPFTGQVFVSSQLITANYG
jgi:hypothetical protein